METMTRAPDGFDIKHNSLRSLHLKIGNATQQTITAFEGTWDGSPLPTFTVERWEHCDDENGNDCHTLTGETSWQLVPNLALAGRYLRVIVTATNNYGMGTAASVPVLVQADP